MGAFTPEQEAELLRIRAELRKEFDRDIKECESRLQRFLKEAQDGLDTLPETLRSALADLKREEQFDVATLARVLLKKGIVALDDLLEAILEPERTSEAVNKLLKDLFGPGPLGEKREDDSK